MATFQLVSEGGHQPDRAVKQKLYRLKLCQVLKVFKSWSPVKRMSDDEKAPKSFHLCQFPEESNKTKKQTQYTNTNTNTMSPELRVREPRSNLPSLGGWRVWVALASCCQLCFRSGRRGLFYQNNLRGSSSTDTSPI